MDKMKLLVIGSSSVACVQYRILIPYLRLKETQNEIDITIRDRFIQYDLNELKKYDVILFQRVSEERILENIRSLRKDGRVVGMDIDDDLNSIPSHNPSFSFYNNNPNVLKTFNDTIRECDFIHVTTPLLKDKLIQDTNTLPSKVYHYNNALCMNQKYIDKRGEFDKDKITFGFQGGSTHYIDLHEVKDVVNEVLNKYKNSIFLYCSTPSQFDLFKTFSERSLNIPPTHSFDEFKSIPSYFDIGLAPLQYNEFNKYKSYLKILEYSVFKRPTIVTSWGDYKNYKDLNNDGVEAIDNSHLNWYNKICELIEDQEKRLNVGREAYNFLFGEHSLDSINLKRLEFYRNLK